MKNIFITVFCFLIFSNLLAASYHTRQPAGIRARGLGGAYRAAATGNNAIYYNPAGLPLAERYDPQIEYTYGFESASNNLDFSIVDSATSKLAAGVAYNLEIASGSDSADFSHLISLALAYPVWEDVLNLGLTGKYYNLPGEERTSKFSLDAGAVAILPFGFLLGATLNNFIPTELAEVPMGIAFGASFNVGGVHIDTGSTKDKKELGVQHGEFGGFTLSADYVMDDLLKYSGDVHKSLHFGASYLVAESVPVRVGYMLQDIDLSNSHALTIGSGFISEIIAIEAFFEQGITNTEQRMLGVMFDFYM